VTFDDLIGEICSRVNDPDRDTYGGSAEDLAYEGISTLAKSGKYEKEDIPLLIRVRGITMGQDTDDEGQIKVYGSTNNLGNDNVLKVLGITDDPGDITRSTYKIIPISIGEYNRLSNDSELDPLSDEVFYWEWNYYLRFFPLDRLANKYIYVHYIKDPGDLSGELTGDFSTSFQYNVINYATEKLKMEIAGA